MIWKILICIVAIVFIVLAANSKAKNECSCGIQRGCICGHDKSLEK